MELVRRIMTNQAEELAQQRIDQYLGSDTEDDGEWFGVCCAISCNLYANVINYRLNSSTDTRLRVASAKNKCCSA